MSVIFNNDPYIEVGVLQNFNIKYLLIIDIFGIDLILYVIHYKFITFTSYLCICRDWNLYIEFNAVWKKSQPLKHLTISDCLIIAQLSRIILLQ